MTKRLLYFLCILANCLVLHGQKKPLLRIERLADSVMKYNDRLEFEKSMKIMSEFIADDSITPYEQYQAYLIKSYTYKRLFNYEQALYNLDLAHKAGSSSKIPQVENTIKAEKALIYFDIRNYKKSAELIKELAQTDYKHLSCNTKSFLIMQLGYLLMLEKSYNKAEQTLDNSLDIMADCSPRDMPNIYAKKVELYNKMKLYDKRDEAFQKGLEIAQHYKIIKYELYLYEVMRNQFKENMEYEKMYYVQSQYDSLNLIYDAPNNNGKLNILEQESEAKRNEKMGLEQKRFNYLLIGLLSIAGALLIGIILLYKSNNNKKKIVEKENERISNEILNYTQTFYKETNTKFNLNEYDLTDRQRNIIRLIQEGRTNKEIGAILYISENTVKYHLKIIYDMLEIKNRSELTRLPIIEKDEGEEPLL